MPEEEYDPIRELGSAMTYKERLLLDTLLTPEEAKELETAWQIYAEGDNDREKLFFVAYQIGMGNAWRIIARQADQAIVEAKAKMEAKGKKSAGDPSEKTQ